MILKFTYWAVLHQIFNFVQTRVIDALAYMIGDIYICEVIDKGSRIVSDFSGNSRV